MKASTAKVLDVICVLVSDHYTVKELAGILQCSKKTIRRILYFLEKYDGDYTFPLKKEVIDISGTKIYWIPKTILTKYFELYGCDIVHLANIEKRI